MVVPPPQFSVGLPVELDGCLSTLVLGGSPRKRIFLWRLTNHRWSTTLSGANGGADGDVTNVGGRGIQRVEKRRRDKLRPHFQVSSIQSITSGCLYGHENVSHRNLTMGAM
jgi:hypothetical protein